MNVSLCRHCREDWKTTVATESERETLSSNDFRLVYDMVVERFHEQDTLGFRRNPNLNVVSTNILQHVHSEEPEDGVLDRGILKVLGVENVGNELANCGALGAADVETDSSELVFNLREDVRKPAASSALESVPGRARHFLVHSALQSGGQEGDVEQQLLHVPELLPRLFVVWDAGEDGRVNCSEGVARGKKLGNVS